MNMNMDMNMQMNMKGELEFLLQRDSAFKTTTLRQI